MVDSITDQECNPTTITRDVRFVGYVPVPSSPSQSRWGCRSLEDEVGSLESRGLGIYARTQDGEATWLPLLAENLFAARVKA